MHLLQHELIQHHLLVLGQQCISVEYFRELDGLVVQLLVLVWKDQLYDQLFNSQFISKVNSFKIKLTNNNRYCKRSTGFIIRLDIPSRNNFNSHLSYSQIPISKDTIKLDSFQVVVGMIECCLSLLKSFVFWMGLGEDAYNLNNMGGSSQTQNVQRGILMLLFINFALLTIFVIIRFCKKQIDIQDDDDHPPSTKYADKDKPNQSENQKESQQHIDRDFDKAAVKRSQLKQDATTFQKFLHGVQQFVYYYCPYLILLPLNILTGTSKAFSLSLFFIISICIGLFNFGKLHKKLGDSKCLNVFFENIWLMLCFFFCVNQWAGTPVAMPYIVLGK